MQHRNWFLIKHNRIASEERLDLVNHLREFRPFQGLLSHRSSASKSRSRTYDYSLFAY
jgi:hypothetical protein